MKKFMFLYIFLGLLFVTSYSIKNIFFLKNIPIEKISQLSLQKEALSSLYLTELLELSYDKKTYLEDFDLKKGQKKLLASPLIDEAELYFIKNNHLQVSYRHVTPIAILGDFENTAIDKDGKIFPIKPFLSPKGLLEVYLGINKVKKTFCIHDYPEKKRWEFAKKVLTHLNNLNIHGKFLSLDVSKIEEKSLGKNEIILSIGYQKRKDILRLTKRNYLNELSYYIILCEKSTDEEGLRMVDLRYDDLALIENF